MSDNKTIVKWKEYHVGADQMRDHLNDVSPSFCLAKWTQVTMHLQNGTNHSCHHPAVHKIPLEEIKANPNVEFFVEDLESQAKELELQADVELTAMEKFSATTTAEKKGLLKILNGFERVPMRGIDNLSETIIKAELYKKLKNDPKKFIEIASDKDLSTRVMIEELLEQGKLTKKSNYYVYEGESLGSSIDGVLEFFKDPKKQSIKIAAKQDVKKHTKED